MKDYAIIGKINGGCDLCNNTGLINVIFHPDIKELEKLCNTCTPDNIKLKEKHKELV